MNPLQFQIGEKVFAKRTKIGTVAKTSWSDANKLSAVNEHFGWRAHTLLIAVIAIIGVGAMGTAAWRTRVTLQELGRGGGG